MIASYRVQLHFPAVRGYQPLASRKGDYVVQTTQCRTGVSTSAADASTRVTSDPPRHWNAHWGHYALFPKSYKSDGTPLARRPIMSLPEYCGADPGTEDYQYVAQYWKGIRYTWDELNKIVSGEHGIMRVSHGVRSKNYRPKHIGISPHANGLVVLDCDVRTAYASRRPVSGHAGRAVFGTVGVQRKRGIDDLAALCSTLGHDLSELATYTVRTKSGGLHLYFHQSIETPIESTSHHRENWLIDVIASEHNWVAAPPTPGYDVVCDYPVATMPDWLAEAINSLGEHFEPVGGKKRRAADERVHELRKAVWSQEKTFSPSDGSLLGKWIAAQLQLIRVANDSGCWNLTIYQVTKDLARMGWDYESIETVVLAAAQPWSDREERNAIATIRSGFKNLSRNSGR